MLDFGKDVVINDNDICNDIEALCKQFEIECIFSYELNGERWHPFDYVLSLSNGTVINVEVKNNNSWGWNNDCIPLEQYTDVFTGRRGWVHHLNRNEVDVVMHYNKKTGESLFYNAKQVCEWWIEHCDDYEIKENEISTKDDSIWQSAYSWIPIEYIENYIIEGEK